MDRGCRPVAVTASLVLAALIGWFYAQVHNRIGVPSFVITLGGLLGFLGVQLWILGPKGSINLPFDSGLVAFAQLQFLPPWLAYTLVVVGAAVLCATGAARAAERRRAGLAATSRRLLVGRSLALLAGLGAAVWYLNRDRGWAGCSCSFWLWCWCCTTSCPVPRSASRCTRSAATWRRPGVRASM